MEMGAAPDLTETEIQAMNELAIDTSKLNLWYGDFQALFDINLQIKKGRVTSLIGPSGCGKSTFLRSVNRINERLGYVTINGSINVFGTNVYAPEVELVQVRKQVMQTPWKLVTQALVRSLGFQTYILYAWTT